MARYHGDFRDFHTDDQYRDNRSKQQQQQALMQSQRSAEASAQMVYEVFGNVIAILEEVEQRELKTKSFRQQLPRSEIYLPSQSHKQDKDVTTILEAQLLLLESQLKTCRSEIRNKVKDDLLKQTYQWNGERQDHKLPNDHRTDHYVTKLVEIITDGSTSHPDKFRQSPGDIKGVTQKDMEHVLGAQHKIVQLDRQFEDPTRKAQPPRIRYGDVRKGAERVRSTRRHYGDEQDMK